MSDRKKALIRGEHLIYIDTLMIVSWIFFFTITLLGYLDYSTGQWITSPLLLAIASMSLLLSLGVRKGIVSKIPEDRDRELTQIMAKIITGAVVASATVLLASLL